MLMSVVQIHLSPPRFYEISAGGACRDFFLQASSDKLFLGQLFDRGFHMTIAWLQRFITLGSLIASLCLAAWLWSEHRVWAWAVLLLPALITPVILAIQCVWAANANRQDPAPSASVAEWLGAWWAECAIAVKVFMWWQPFRHLAIADQLQSTPGKRGMVLVHGYFCNRALWTDWMQHLHAQGHVFVAVDLEPAFGSISHYAQVVEKAVAAVEKATGLPPVIVGHSMGGLAIRAWAAEAGSASTARAHRIFTLGTPHHGTAIAQAAHTENGKQMRLRSDWLASNASLLPHDFAKKCTCYYSHCDNIVFPASTATLEGADNQHLAGYAHVHLAFAPEIQQACWAALES
jgi:triacylglycerol lipase